MPLTDAQDPLLAWRQHFPILERKCYLVSHSLGAMPAGVPAALARYASLWAEEGIEAWDTWFPLVQEVGDGVGRLMGAPPKTVTMHPNVTSLQAVVASCLDFQGPRREVVYEAMNFTTVHYLWKGMEGLGAQVHLVDSPDGIHVPTERMLEAISDRTLIVPMSHVLFQSNYLQDAKAIIDKAHHHGAMVVLDAYQSLGIVPFNAVDLGVDFVVGGSVKWLCGGPGAAYLYTRPDLIPQLQPRQVGWLSHAQPFAFRMDMEYAPDAMRFLGGSPAVAALMAAQEGHRLIEAVGVEAIRAKSLRQTRWLMEQLEARGLEIKNPRVDARRGGTVCVDFPGSAEVAKGLLAAGVQIDHRPQCGIRVSPHFYTSQAELERFVDTLEVLLQERKAATP